MNRFRLKLRTLFVVVAVASYGCFLAALWVRVGSDFRDRYLIHVCIAEDDPGATSETTCGAPFWPQLGRKALMLPWPGGYRCDCVDVARGVLEIDEPLGMRRYRYAASRAPDPDEAAMIAASLRSLKVLGPLDSIP